MIKCKKNCHCYIIKSESEFFKLKLRHSIAAGY